MLFLGRHVAGEAGKTWQPPVAVVVTVACSFTILKIAKGQVSQTLLCVQLVQDFVETDSKIVSSMVSSKNNGERGANKIMMRSTFTPTVD